MYCGSLARDLQGASCMRWRGMKEHIHMLLDTYIVMKTNDRESLLWMMVLALVT